MRVIFMGTPDFSVPVLTTLVEGGYDVVAVYTKTDKPSGRGRHNTASPIKHQAQKLGLHIEEPITFKDAAVVEHMATFEPDITVVASYGHILPKSVIDMPKIGCLNIHPSLLPKYRGPSPVASAVLNGDSKTGVTVMTVLPKVDSGHILAQTETKIGLSDTTAALTPKLFEIGARLLINTIPGWVKGDIVAQPQDESMVTYSRTFAKDDGRIDWSAPAQHIARMVCAFDPWPGCYTTLGGKILKIIEATAISVETTDLKAGQIIELNDCDGNVGVVTGNGVLVLNKVQMAGKRPMPITDFTRGQHEFIGSILQ
ncbi:MAG: methionyl-tRNA formyltransferase [Chloroflexi bacterium]|nr:methionyl-tRNA formyltransferase [Chloroflexota bacterium]MBT7081547.1 methionyl-tRNA formyltransferase [Chloroflexota bacterium]MBT7289433.1 methionyl-tRNA formyltransferase [Chloroflexota bacterium]